MWATAASDLDVPREGSCNRTIVLSLTSQMAAINISVSVW
jgi:hypothetical protein